MKFCAYLVTNVRNGKRYVGITKDWSVRWKKHVWEASSKCCRLPFHKAIRKHGPDSFVFEVLAWNRIRQVKAKSKSECQQQQLDLPLS